jgi:tetratricopeptide (TPR) repeat protein
VKARLLLNAGDNVGAVALLEIALKKDETHPKLLEEIGRIYKKEGNLEKAARYFEKGRKVAPVDGNWLRELIDIYLKEKDSPRLIDVLSEQVANDADDLKSRLQLANLLLEAKEFAKAEAIAWDALLIDVTNPEAQQAMLSALEGQNKVELLEKFKTRFQK